MIYPPAVEIVVVDLGQVTPDDELDVTDSVVAHAVTVLSVSGAVPEVVDVLVEVGLTQFDDGRLEAFARLPEVLEIECERPLGDVLVELGDDRLTCGRLTS